MYLVQMQFKNIYIVVNTQACTSCLNGVKKHLLTKSKNKIKIKINSFVACKVVTTCCDKNVIHDSTIRRKTKTKRK